MMMDVMTSASAASALPVGAARARIAMVDGCSSVTLQQARSPSKLLIPCPRGKAVWLCHLTFGGGVVAGDRIDLQLQIEQGSTTLSATQGATKIYRDPDARWSEQHLRAHIAKDALLVHLPHPVTAYAGARYRQQTTFDCAAGGSVLWWDVLTAGRPDQGEHWSADAVHLSTQLQSDKTVIARDALRLHGDLSREQLQHWRCVVTMGLYGPGCKEAAQELLANPPANSKGARWVVSPLADGCLLRGLTTSAEIARDTCRAANAWLVEQLGDDPWRRLM